MLWHCHHQRARGESSSKPQQHSAPEPRGRTRYVGGDLGERRLPKALARAGTHREEVRGAGVQVGEDVVGLIAQLGDRAPRAGHVDRRVGGLDALVADLEGQGQGITRGQKLTAWQKGLITGINYRDSPAGAALKAGACVCVLG